MSIEPADNILEVKNSTMRISRIEVGQTFVVGNVEFESPQTLASVSNTGNTTPYTIEFTNPTTGLATTSNLVVGNDLHVEGNIYSDSNLSVQYTTENPSNTWAQVGGDLNGEAAGDYFGLFVALSSDGTRLAVGARQNDGGGSDAGHVRVFDLVGGAWTQVGGDIDGEAAGDLFGSSVALSSDGTRLAVGAYGNDGTGTSAGHVRVFDLVGGAWTQVGGDIDGEAAGDRSGSRVALSSDGTRLAAGAYLNDGTGTSAGHVRVFEYHQGSSSWIQLGADIDGEAAGDNSGRSVALSSDGTRLAVGAQLNDGTGTDAGHVRVFDWSGSTWTQVGADIDGEAAGDQFGYTAVALSSDGTRLAVGAHLNDGTGTDAGHVRVFDWSGSTWTQVGGGIDGEAAGDGFGISVALSSDGSRLAVGASTDSGQVRVFDLVGGAWTQVGGDLDGDGTAAGDSFGRSVALSSDGTRLAAGAYQNDGAGTDSGQVRVFDYDGVLKTKQILKEDIVEIPGDLRAGCPVLWAAHRTRGDITSERIIIWDTVVLNKSGGYNPIDGLFTAPISGHYSTSWLFRSNNSGGSITGSVYKNGVSIGWGDTNNNPNTGLDAECQSSTVIIYLDVGDTLGIYVSGQLQSGTPGIEGTSLNAFTGFYLST